MVINILFYKGVGFISKIIQLFTDSEFSHVAFRINDYLIDTDIFRSVKVYDIKELDGKFEEVKIPINQMYKYELLMEYLTETRKPYDYRELLRWLLKFIPDNFNSDNCVEFVVNGLNQSEITKIDNKSYSPQELYYILKLK